MLFPITLVPEHKAFLDPSDNVKHRDPCEGCGGDRGK
jgi:hypothetical protein